MGDEYLSKSTPWILIEDEGIGIEGLRTATAAAAASFDFSFSLFDSCGRLESVEGIPFNMVRGGKSLRFATQRRKKIEKFVKSRAGRAAKSRYKRRHTRIYVLLDQGMYDFQDDNFAILSTKDKGTRLIHDIHVNHPEWKKTNST